MAKVTSRLKSNGPHHFVREWRKYRGLTLEQLAERVEVTHGALSQLERGLVNYTQPMLEALADALNCEAGDLIMRNPLAMDALWSIKEQLAKASPEQQRQALAVIETLLKTGTDG